MKKRIAAQQDYSLAQLPHTRKEVFFDIVCLYGGSLFRLGLILLSFALPLLICGYIKDENELAYLAMLQQASDAERKGIFQALQLTNSLVSLFSIVGYVIFSIGVSAAARMIRQYAWEEPVNVKLELPIGIRQNGKPFLLLGFLTGCWMLLCGYCFTGALYAPGGQALLGILPALMGLMVLLPVLGYALVTNSVYSNSFGQNLRISLVLYLKKPLLSAGISFLMASIPLLAEMIPWIAARTLLRIVVIVAMPFLLLIWYLWCYDRMDAHINPTYYPELIGKGLIKEALDCGAEDTQE